MDPFDSEALCGLEKLQEVLFVLDRLAVRQLPAPLDPAVHPLGHAVDEEGAVGVNGDIPSAKTLDLLQRPYRRVDLCAVVGLSPRQPFTDVHRMVGSPINTDGGSRGTSVATVVGARAVGVHVQHVIWVIDVGSNAQLARFPTPQVLRLVVVVFSLSAVDPPDNVAACPTYGVSQRHFAEGVAVDEGPRFFLGAELLEARARISFDLAFALGPREKDASISAVSDGVVELSFLGHCGA